MLTRSLLAACALALGAPSFADDAHHPGEQTKPAASAPAAKMPEMMSRMQEQMEKIQAASDPKERQRLVEEHMKTMNESMMPMMRAMSGNTGTGEAQRMQMMERCMGAMQKDPAAPESAPN